MERQGESDYVFDVMVIQLVIMILTMQTIY